MKHDKRMRKLEHEIKDAMINQRLTNEIHNEAHRLVLKNIYHNYYDLPTDQQYRKPDQLMKIVVDGSETLAKVKKLHEFGLHPSLIFFSSELYDN
tara:strand:- start:167 stop:451 length:285 start_codon:yes stop_codon:yes gene_type:complete